MAKKRQSIDPQEQRYYQAYPHFPGIAQGLTLLRHRKGGYWEAVFGDFETHAPELLDELIQVCRDTSNADIRWMLLEIIGGVQSTTALTLFTDYLTDPDERVRWWAAYGLHALNTKEARTFLWDARTRALIQVEDPNNMRGMLDEIQKMPVPGST